MDQVAFAGQRSRGGQDRAHEIDLHLDRGVALARFQRRVDRAGHGAVEEGGNPTAVDRPDRVEELYRRHAGEDGPAFRYAGEINASRAREGRGRVRALDETLKEGEARLG